VRADDLAAQLVAAAMAKVPELDPDSVDDLLMGCGLPAGEQGYNMGRVVAVRLGYDRVPGTTVTRNCASSLQTTRMAMHAIKAGEGSAFISAGVESVSRYRAYGPVPQTRNPFFAKAGERTAQESTGDQHWTDPRAGGELPDIYIAMGQTAENVADVTGIGRAEQDEWALCSQQRAEAAVKSGHFAREITPVLRPDATEVSTDDGPRFGTTIEGLARLEPVFRPDGTVTAGNACPINDGAAALIVMSGVKAAELGITPLARIVATGVSGLSPEIMGLGPVEASRRALALAGMTMADVDLVEINEAFGVQVLGSARELGIEHDKLNVSGGAIALGHPFGMTGARITTSLLNNLTAHDKQIGLETMCVGGGQGMAMLVERLS
jgi:acetyl-CoA C-acetyltransferase